jgi:hypothetical protein
LRSKVFGQSTICFPRDFAAWKRRRPGGVFRGEAFSATRWRNAIALGQNCGTQFAAKQAWPENPLF